jgi:hypothetical protein
MSSLSLTRGRPALPAARRGAAALRRPTGTPVRLVAVLETTRAPSPSRAMAPASAAPLAEEIAAKLAHDVGAAPGAPLTPVTAYRGVAASVRERLIDGRNATQAHWE